jgi:hypothetical protein
MRRTISLGWLAALVVSLGGCSKDEHAATTEVGTWTAGGGLASARDGASATALADGTVLVCGGATDAPFAYDQAVATCDRVDPATGHVSPGPTMNDARQYHAAVRLADGRLLVAGGLGLHSPPEAREVWLATAEVLDAAATAWIRVGAMHEAKAGMSAARLLDGKVLLAAGWDGGAGDSATAELFDPSTNQFVQTGSLHVRRSGNASALLKDGRMLLVGGFMNGGWDVAPTMEVYDPATGAWTMTTMPGGLRRLGAMAVALPDGDVLLAGGCASAPGCGDEAWTAFVHGPSGWTEVAPMPTAHAFGVALRLDDGRVLVASGGNERIGDPGAVYDPDSATWAPTAPMPAFHGTNAAGATVGGRAVIAGGMRGAVPGVQATPAVDVWAP